MMMTMMTKGVGLGGGCSCTGWWRLRWWWWWWWWQRWWWRQWWWQWWRGVLVVGAAAQDLFPRRRCIFCIGRIWVRWSSSGWWGGRWFGHFWHFKKFPEFWSEIQKIWWDPPEQDMEHFKSFTDSHHFKIHTLYFNLDLHSFDCIFQKVTIYFQ